MEIFRNNLKGDEISLRKRNDAYARSISILHVLQTSLDFENGEEIADNLFLLYEFARVAAFGDFSEWRDRPYRYGHKLVAGNITSLGSDGQICTSRSRYVSVDKVSFLNQFLVI